MKRFFQVITCESYSNEDHVRAHRFLPTILNPNSHIQLAIPTVLLSHKGIQIC